jgi:DNA mismatch endonuclease (patch repair protein)
MSDIFSKTKRSQVMSRIRSTGNRATELRLISLMRRHRITGWRRGAIITGKPDFVFRVHRIAVFVDGCFWHGCRKHSTLPKSNRRYWIGKIRRNTERDKTVNRELRRRGWRVVRVWEHELSRKNEAQLLRRLASCLCFSSTSPVDTRNR